MGVISELIDLLSGQYKYSQHWPEDITVKHGAFSKTVKLNMDKFVGQRNHNL